MPSVLESLFKGGKRFVISRICILHPPGVPEECVFRSDSCIIESRRDRVRAEHIALSSLKQVALRALEYADRASGKTGCVLTCSYALPPPRRRPS